MRSKLVFSNVDSWFDMPKCKFIMENTENHGCALPFFIGRHKNNLRLWLRSFFKYFLIYIIMLLCHLYLCL